EVGEVAGEHIADLELVARRLDLQGLEHEVRLIDMHLPAVDAVHVVGAGADRLERPETGVAAEVEDALALEGAAVQIDDGLEEVLDALAMPVPVAFVPDRRLHALEIELVVPLRERSDPLSNLVSIHSDVTYQSLAERMAKRS